MKTLAELVSKFFNHDKSRFEQIGKNHILKTGFQGKNGVFPCYIDINEKNRTLLIYTTSPINVPEHKRLQTAEFIARINQSLVLGNFEIGMDDGKVTYKTSIILGKSSLHQDVIKHLIYANWMASDEYYPAISTVAFGNVSPKKAVEIIKQQHKSDPRDVEEDNNVKRISGRLGDNFGQSLN